MLRSTCVLAITVFAVCVVGHAAPSNPLVLESFESAEALARWSPRSVSAELTTAHATEGSHAVKLKYPAWQEGAERWPAFIRDQSGGIPELKRWKLYSKLQYDLYVEPGPDVPEGTDSVNYKLRVDDVAGTRWTTSLRVPVGEPHTVEIPFRPSVGFGDRGLAHVDLFMSQPAHSWTIYLDNIRLVANPLEVEKLQLQPDPFHLGNDGVRARFSLQASYRIEIRNAEDELVRADNGRAVSIDWNWDGETDAGEMAPDGSYKICLKARSRFSPPGWAVDRLLGTTRRQQENVPEYVWWPLRSTEEVYLWTLPQQGRMERRTLSLKLARNEYEASQIAIRPRPGRSLQDVQIRVEGLVHERSGSPFPAEDVNIYQVGHVKTHEPPPPYDYDFLGWHPDPLIERNTFDIADGDTQAVWVQLKTPADIEPGQYKGSVIITSKDAPQTDIPFSVTVWDFTLPDISHCRTLFDLRGTSKLYPDRDTHEVRRQYQNFVLQHRINPGRIYNRDVPDEEFLSEFIPRGMNAVNLSYISDREFTQQAADEMAAKLDPVVRFLREKGWTDVAYLYGFDETRSWENLKDWADWIEERYPDIRFSTTSRDATYGVETGIDNVDAWVPLTPAYDRELADARREEGCEIWWYICIGPHHPYANWFIEYPLIEARLLWWMTHQYDVDGFLYYALNRWPVNEKPLEGAPKTDWDPASYKSANGDGCLFYAGPDGPLTGMRFETVRDGLEEYEYLWLLQQKLGSRERGEQIAGKIIRSLTDYTRDSEEFYSVREELAEAILGAGDNPLEARDEREADRLPLDRARDSSH
ncbi:MAG: DUF6067 family protein [Armatimonadota bacterium]